MSKKLYVGNLAYSESEQDLNHLFSEYGVVESVKIVTDRETGKSKGFGFIEMADQESADKAAQILDGRDHGGRALKVNPARPQEKRSSGGERTFRR